jgi:hypothetical protein
MKNNLLITASMLLIFFFLQTGCDLGKDDILFQVLVSNETEMKYTDLLVEVDITPLDWPIPDSLIETMILSSDELHPFQFIDNNRDGNPDKLLILTNLEPVEQKRISAFAGQEQRLFTQRTQAELSVKVGGVWEDRKYVGGSFQNIDSLRVPAEHTDHSFYIRYEGPGWESDKVGYRFYLDWRNAIDVFGKMTGDMVLQDVGQDGFDSYHEPAEWGMDIMKVGESLGLGSIGIWSNEKANRIADTDSICCEINASGPIYSEIETNYYGWKAGSMNTDLRSILSISAGSRLTHHKVMTSSEVDNLCTGIAIDKNANFLISEPERDGWSYLASYGRQSLADDNVGLAILFRSEDLVDITEDALSRVIVLKPSEKTIEYYFLAAWEKELNGISGEDEFVRYLEQTVSRMNNPPAVTLIPL